MKRNRIAYCFFFITSILLAQENVSEVGRLPNEVTETSGLLFYNGRLITHNDSGNTPQLFEIDTLSLEVVRTVTVSNAINVDWEDITQDKDYLYIGDFGNYNGDRRDLTIYRISKQDYTASDTVTADRIDFSYENQTNFIASPMSDWDAEALFEVDDRLIVLTKQWQSQETTAYSIPKDIGTHIATEVGNYAVNGLVTGATFNELTGALFILGHTQLLGPFVIRMNNITGTSIFGNGGERTDLNIGFAQVEGITHVTANTYFFSSERFVNNSPPITLQSRLFTFRTTDETEGEGEGEENPEEDNDEGQNEELILYRSFGSLNLQYDLRTEEKVFGRAIFDPAGRRIRFTNGDDIEGNSIDLSTLGASVYYLTFYLQGGVMSKPFVSN